MPRWLSFHTKNVIHYGFFKGELSMSKKRETTILPNNLWEQVISSLETQLSKPSIDMWFEPVNAAVFGERLHIACPNEMIKDWLEIRYAPLIQKVVKEITGQVVDLRFTHDTY